MLNADIKSVPGRAGQQGYPFELGRVYDTITQNNRRTNMAIFDDDGFGAEELAIALGFADIMSEEKRDRQCSFEDPEPLIPDEDALQWYEKD